MAGIPFKACILGGTNGTDVVAQVGVVAKNYQNFRELLQVKYGLERDFQVFLDDGTQVCDEEYFEVLEPQTKLTVVQRGVNRPRVGEKRPLVIAPADSATSLHQSKQGRLMSPTQEAISAITATAASHDSLISCLRIASVTGNVNMAASPTRTSTPTQSIVRSSISPPQQAPSPPLRSQQTPPFQHPQQIHIQSVASVGPAPHSAPPLAHLPRTLAQELSAAQARQYCQLLQQQQLRQQQQLHLHQQQQQHFHHQQQQLQQLHYSRTQLQAGITSPPGVITSPPNVYAPSVHPQQPQQSVTYQPVQRTLSHRGMPANPQAPFVFSHQDGQNQLQAHPPPRPQHQMVIVSPPPIQPQFVTRQSPPSAPHQPTPLHHMPSMQSACEQERQTLPPPLLAMTMAAMQRRNSAPGAASMSQQPRAEHLQSSVSPIVNAVNLIAQPERLTHRLSPQPNLFHPTAQAPPKRPLPQLPAPSVRQPVISLPTSKVIVVNCKDVITPSSSVEDTDDEGSLRIIERSSSTCSTPSTPPPPHQETPAFSFEATKSRSTPPIPPSQLATCAHTALKDQATKVALQENALSESRNNDDNMNIESPLDIETDDLSGRRFSAASPDDGYASSTSFGSANDITSKLPFADFESSMKSFAATLLPGLEPGEHSRVRDEKEHLTEAVEKAVCVPKSASEERMQADKESPRLSKTPTPEAHEQQSTKEENEPSLVVEERPEGPGTVDTRLYHTLMQDSKEILVIDADDVSDSPPSPTPPTPPLKLVLSIPIHCNEEGKILCQGLTEALQTASFGDASKVDSDETQRESSDELVVSIPMRHLVSGIICGAVRDKEDEMDEPMLQSGLAKLNSEKEKAIPVQEYASEELVVTSSSRLRSSSGCFRVRSKRSRNGRSRMQSKRPRSGCSLVQTKKPSFCTQADITKAVKEIIADLRSVDCEEADINDSVAEKQVLMVSEQMELAVDGGSEDGEKILLVSSDFGNEVVVSEEQDNDEESEVEMIMSSLENAPPQQVQEEIETEVVQIECLAGEHHSEQSVCSVYTASEDTSISRDQDQQPNDSTEVQELSQKIEGLLELADLLSPLESKTIKDFFNGKHSDPPTRGLQTYCLKELSDTQAVFLEINFETRKWRGFVSHSL